ncbi:hypothetical protein Tco_0954724 [Tanacetum coccineum]|uniref:Uncharacterized protein n=1 Tax=Tanacetum coccineum TaxID=301880 RepID=A0ABQ5E567_9ASTR
MKPVPLIVLSDDECDAPTRTKHKRLIKNGIIVNNNDHEVLRQHNSSKETSYQRMRKRLLIVISDDNESDESLPKNPTQIKRRKTFGRTMKFIRMLLPKKEIKEEPQDWFTHVKKPTLPSISKPLAYNLIDEATDDEFIDHVNFEKDFPNLLMTTMMVEDLYDFDMYNVRSISDEEEKDSFINDASTNYYSTDDDNNGGII